MPHASHPRPTGRAVLALAAGLLLVGTMPLAAGATPQNGFKTSQAPMLVPGAGAPLGTEVKALITVGDTIGDYRFESIPDGIAFLPEGKNAARVWVNHETSTVPFPYGPNGAAPTTSNSFNDFNNSELSEFVIRKGGQILSAEMVIDTGAGYQRFCASFLATTDGFENRPTLFLNEEGIDWIYEDVQADGLSWTNDGSLQDAADAREIGAVVAYDVETGEHAPIWGMGRHNHENTLAVPGYDKPVLLSGDDTFTSNPAQSQVYSYIAGDADEVWEDEGALYAFVSDDPAVNSYYDFPINSTASVSGTFIEVPKEIATGKNPDGTDMMAADVPAALGGPYPLPPDDATWSRPPGSPFAASPPVAGVDGPQWVLEHWSDLNNAFQFIRIEDMAFDRRPGMANVVYMIDSGRGATSAGGNAFTSSNGRIWKMVLDENDPTVVDSLSILIEGDDSPVKTLNEIHQPDNIESTPNGLYITEDGSSSQAFVVADQGLPNATTNRIWQYRFSDSALNPVLRIDQSADEGPTDVDTSGISRWGDWEASGIIDVSSVFGPGKFLVTVQAHTLFVEVNSTSAPDNLAPAGPDWTFKREGGQLLLVTIPGG